MKRLAIRAISLVLVLVFFTDTACYGLATLPASQNPIAKREILAALNRTQIRYAESEDAIKLLKANNASCLLLSSGKYLVTKEVAQNDVTLLRAIIHEEIEAIMQILMEEGRRNKNSKYQGIKELTLKYFPPTDGSDALETELYINHTIAKAFEWLIPIADGIILEVDIAEESRDFINAIDPIIKANKHNYFTAEFWDFTKRSRKIRSALNAGIRFYQVASISNNESVGYSRVVNTIQLEGNAVVIVADEKINTSFVVPPPAIIPSAYEAVEVKKYADQALEKGTIGLITVAGGMSSRAGIGYPKGLHPITPLSGKSLFQARAEELLAAKNRYGREIAWYIMTSELTDIPTREYFASNGYFDLGKKNVIFIKQDKIAAFEAGTHKLAMQDEKTPLYAPNGNGSIYKSMRDQKARTDGGQISALEDAAIRGIRTFLFSQVDNPLPVVDRTVIGYHLKEGSDFTTVLVKKRDLNEGLGMVAQDAVTGQKFFIEYNQPAAKIIKDRAGFEYGSITRLVFSYDLVASANQPPYHIARDKKAKIFKDGRVQDGLIDKLECFGFDALAEAKRSINIVVPREECFAPFKMMTGPDSPEAVGKALSNYWKMSIKKAIPGVSIPESFVVELPWEADYMSSEKLADRLVSCGFTASMDENTGIMVYPGFSKIELKKISPISTAATTSDLSLQQSKIKIEGSGGTIVVPNVLLYDALAEFGERHPEIKTVVKRVMDDLSGLGNKAVSIQDVKRLFPDEQGASKRIAFTGPPYAGKTNLIKEKLSNGKYKNDIIWIPEAISIFKKAGIEHNTNNSNRLIYIIKYLLEREAALEHPEKIIACDRGTIDTFGYWQGDTEELDREIGGIEKEYSRYRAVIMMQGVASVVHARAEFKDRDEAVGRAVDIEKLLLTAWKDHPRFNFIEHTDWGSKNEHALNVFDGLYADILKRETETFINECIRTLKSVEGSFWKDKESGLGIEESMPHRSLRRDITYETGRSINRYLMVNGKRLESGQLARLQEIYRHFKTVARENALYFLPSGPGVYHIKKEWVRAADVMGEQFLFFALHSSYPYYSFPYQVTFSITPPGHRQEIHGHFFTKELTVSMGEGLFFEVYKIKDGSIVATERVSAPKFYGTGYGINTPHILGNSGSVPCPNITVKYDEGIHDRWNLRENPNESTYTFETGLQEPNIERMNGNIQYSFDKGEVTYRIVRIPPGGRYDANIEERSERGFFVVSGRPSVYVSNGRMEFSPNEGDIIYVKKGADDKTFIANETRDDLIIFYVDLANEKIEEFSRKALQRRFKALVVDIDGVLTEDDSRLIRPEVIQKLIARLEEGIPICICSGRNRKFSTNGQKEHFYCTEEVVVEVRKELERINKTNLLSKLFIASELGIMITNGYADTDPRFETYDTGVDIEAILSERQERILALLREKGLIFEGMVIERKDHSMALINIPDGSVQAIGNEISGILEKEKVLGKIDLMVKKKAIYAQPKGAAKSLALAFLAKRYGIKDEEIAAFDDKADKGGTGHDIVDRPGGFAVREADKDSTFMVDVTKIEQGLSGYKALEWVLDRLSFTDPEDGSSSELERLYAEIELTRRLESQERVSRWREDVLRRIGLNSTYVPREEQPDYHALAESFDKAVSSGKTSNGTLTSDDVEFLKIYGRLFGKEYFTLGTMSGYKNYKPMPDITNPRVEAIIRECDLKKGSRVLDVGCAFGYYVEALRERGIEAEGIDISHYAIEQSHGNTRKYLHILNRLDALNSLPAKSFELIIIKDVLEHVPEELLPRFLNSLRRLGKNILISVPVTDQRGFYINRDDEHDFTHVVKRDKYWWLSLLGADAKVLDDLCVALKGDKATGTLCALVPIDVDLPAKRNGRHTAVLLYRDELYSKMRSQDIEDTSKAISTILGVSGKLTGSAVDSMEAVDAGYSIYKELAEEHHGKDSDYSNFLIYRVRSGLRDALSGAVGKTVFDGKSALERLSEFCEKDALGAREKRVADFIIKYFIADLDEDPDKLTYSVIYDVVSELFRSPDSTVQYICGKYTLKADILKKIYALLRRSPLFQDLMSKKSSGSALVRYYKDFIKNKERIKAILTGTDTYPLVLEIHPSLVCQNNCVMCFKGDRKHYAPRPGSKLLTEEQARGILDDAKEHGVQEIVVSGGLEPLLSPLSIFILDYAKQIGLPTVLITNGRALSNRSILTAALKADKIRVSLLTTDPSAYSDITRTSKEAHTELLESVRQLMNCRKENKFNTKIGLEYMVLPGNYKDMSEFSALAKEIGIDFVDFRHDLITDRGNAAEIEWLADLRRELLRLKANIDSGKYAGVYMTFSPYLNYLTGKGIDGAILESSTAIKSPVCMSRNFRVALNPYGEVYSCCMMTHPGMASDGHYVGTIPSSGKLAEFFKETRQKNIAISGRCHSICTNLDRMLINIQYKLTEDMKMGFAIEDQPYSSGIAQDTLKIALMGTAMVRAEPVKKEDYFKGKIQKKFIQPPFGVYRLQYYLWRMFKNEIESGRLQVDVFDPALSSVAEGDSLDNIFEKVRTEGYNIIGFSPIRVLLGEDLFFMNRVYEEASKSWVRPLCIAGGNEAALNSEVVFGTMPWLDFCIDGLGEPVMERLIQRAYLKLGRGDALTDVNFSDIGGMTYKSGSGITRNTCPRVNADSFRNYSAYAGENIPYEKYWNHNRSIGPVDTTFSGTTIETVRLFTRNFCPYNCPFCSQSVLGRKTYEGAPASLTADQIGDIIKTAYEKKGAKGVYFNDDDMFGDENNAKKILNKIIKMKSDGQIPKEMRFYGQTRVDKINIEVLDLMREAGFAFLSFGVESLSDQSLKADDLRKHFTADEAMDSVRNSLTARIPITNMNLILFHPTITKPAFITTVERTASLLRESIRLRSRLSVNSFPLIEAYAGAPINAIADKAGWPRTTANAEYGSKVWRYTESYLPIDPEMRHVVENDNLMREFGTIMEKFTKDPRWPTTTVSRSIGINSLVMFMAAYNVLNIKPDESGVTVRDMESLVWDLIKTFNPSVEQAASVLTQQKSNVVFTFKDGRAIFRRGAMEVQDIPREIMDALAKNNRTEVLISLQSCDPLRVREALQDAVFNNFTLEEAFTRQGIPVFAGPHFKKVLLVVPCGNYDGTPLKTAVPHPGLERISYSLIRNPSAPDVDCRVFNPNLVGREEILKLITEESFDVIGFSFLPVTLKSDALLIDMVAKNSPKSILIAGGLNIGRLPFEEIFGKIPFDVFLEGPGEIAMPLIMARLPLSRGELPKKELLRRLSDISNLCVYDGNNITMTKHAPFVYSSIDEDRLREDIPYDRPDITHGATYNEYSGKVHSTILPYDMIGTRRLYVKISDRCKGNCIFCSAPKDKTVPEDLDYIVETIKKNRGVCDSVHFADNDLLANKEMAVLLCKKIIKAGLQDIPKVCKSRTDEADPDTLKILRSAGFIIVTYGVESFSDNVLKSMNKGTTSQQNEDAIEMTIDADIKPGMDMIFFSPWESIESLVSSAEKALHYVEKGAYLSVVPEMHVQMGDRFTKEETPRIEFEDIYFESTKSVFRNPKRAILSDDMEKLRKDILERKAVLEDDIKKKYAATHGTYISFSVASLLFVKALYEVLIDKSAPSVLETEYSSKIVKIDEMIDRIIGLEAKRVIGLPKANEYKKSFPGVAEAKKMKLVFLGMPGSGKTTHARKTAELLGVSYIYVGYLLRDIVENPKEAVRYGVTEQQREMIRKCIEQGTLVPNEITDQIVVKRLGDEDALEGFVLDGYPRLAASAGTIENFLERRSQQIDRYIVVDISDAAAHDRLISRRRDDDVDESIERRIGVFKGETKPFLRKRTNILHVNGTGEMTEVFKNIVSLLFNQRPEELEDEVLRQRMARLTNISPTGPPVVSADKKNNNPEDIIKKMVQEDYDGLTVLQLDLLYATLHSDRIYTVKYDDSRLTGPQKEIIELYVELLKKRSSAKIILQKHSREQGSRESLIAVYCTGKDFKGEGHVDVAIPDGELKEYLLRIAGMVNIALAAANIPDNLSREEVEKYRPIMSYIQNQYKAILGEELAIPNSPEDILKVIRRIVLGLPKSLRINTYQIEEFNRLTKQALIAA